jgi:MFS family permease
MALLNSPERRVLIASAAACTVGFATIFVQPVVLAEILASKGLTDASAGFVLTVEMLAVAFSSALCTKLCRGKSFLAIALAGTAIASLGNWGSFAVSGYGALLTTRMLCGFGEGAALMVAGAAPARLPHPEHAYAKINTVTILIGTLLVYIAPMLSRFIAGPVIFPTMFFCFVALVPALLLMPRGERFAPQPALTSTRRPISVTLAMIWASLFLLVVVNSAIFSFSAVIGDRVGLSPDSVSAAIAVATISSLIGCGLAGWVGVRFGRLIPMLGGVIVVTVALVGLSNARNAATFWLSTSVQMIGDYFLMPYFQGYAAEEDPTGRGVAAVNAAIPLSYAVGPFLGGIVAEQLGFSVMGWLAVAVNTIVLGMILCLRPGFATMMRRMRTRQTA